MLFRRGIGYAGIVVGLVGCSSESGGGDSGSMQGEMDSGGQDTAAKDSGAKMDAPNNDGSMDASMDASLDAVDDADGGAIDAGPDVLAAGPDVVDAAMDVFDGGVLMGTTVWIDPPMTTVKLNDTFTVHVAVTTLPKTRGAQAGIIFDPKILQCNKGSEGAFYKMWAMNNGASTFYIAGSCDNMKGVFSVAGVAILGGKPNDGPNGTGDFIDL